MPLPKVSTIVYDSSQLGANFPFPRILIFRNTFLRTLSFGLNLRARSLLPFDQDRACLYDSTQTRSASLFSLIVSLSRANISSFHLWLIIDQMVPICVSIGKTASDLYIKMNWLFSVAHLRVQHYTQRTLCKDSPRSFLLSILLQYINEGLVGGLYLSLD